MLATARQDARAFNGQYGGYSFTVYNFMGAGGQIGDGGPQAYLASVPKGEAVESHFHPVDQFQVFFGDEGDYFQKHSLRGLHVQYADAYTPYGPFGAGPQDLHFFTLRAQATNEHHTMPGGRSKMVRRPGLSVQTGVELSDASGAPAPARTLFERAADGMAAYHIALPSGGSVQTPPAKDSGGQYVIVVQGGMRCRDGSFPFQSCLFLNPDDAPLTMEADATDGCQVLVLQFPRPRP